MTINTKGWCLKCPGCTQALQRATQQADQQFRELHPACTCDSDTGPPECPIATRCKEPLAWTIKPSDIKDQSTSHLYTIIPREIRDMIFTYALTDTTSNPVAQEPPQPQDAEGRRDRYYNTNTAKKFHPSDIAFNLLLACKAVYLETYLLPLCLNPLNIGALDQQMKKNRFQPWQYAQLPGLDIKLPQTALENGALRNLLRGWKAQARHDALHYVVPIEALIHDENIKLDKYPVSFNYMFIPASTTTSSAADKRPQPLIDVLRRTELPESLLQPCSSHLRVVPANSLTHLTLRLGAKGWWMWSSSPDTISPHDQLRLDPTFGDNRGGVRGDTDLMQSLAAQRREGKHPELSGIKCWGKDVTSLLPDLRVLELVLETFQEKKEQVDVVAECARTWRFDVANGVLVWDGEVVAKRWSRGVTGLRLPKDASWSHRCRNYEVRVVRFVRERG